MLTRTDEVAGLMSRLEDGGLGDNEEYLQYVTCRVGDEEFAIEVLSVQEIIYAVDVTRVPKSPVFVEGVINLRGQIVAVLNMRRRLGMPAAAPTNKLRIVMIKERTRLIGLSVDSVSEVVRIPRSAIEPPPSLGTMAAGGFVQYVGRVGDQLLTVLDLGRLIAQS